MIKQKISFFITGLLFFFITGIFFLKADTPGIQSTKQTLADSLSEKNLIIILIDSLRADHLGCYGYDRNTSPFIDSIALKSILFNRAFSNSSYTPESVSAIFSGCFPSSSGASGWKAILPLSVKSMGQIFNKAGFRTAYLSNSDVCRNYNFTRGFDFISFCKNQRLSGNGPELAGKAMTFINNSIKDGRRFLAYLHFLDPHGPYHPPYKYYSKFNGNSKNKGADDSKIVKGLASLYGKVRPDCTDLIKEGFGPGEDRFEDMKMRYDAEISLVDDSIKMLIRGLKEKKILKNSIILITADHGEEFLEHRFVEHAWTLYSESIHIPLILYVPGLVTSRRINDPVSSVNILPTLIKLMNIPYNGADFDGNPLFRFNNDKSDLIFLPRKKPIISELMIQHRNLVRMIFKDNWKYIAAVKWLKPEDRPAVLASIRKIEKDKKKHLDIWGPVVHEELYNLTADPGETLNLVSIEKEKLKQFRKIYNEYKIYCKKKNNQPGKNNQKLSEKDIKKLKSLGYL